MSQSEWGVRMFSQREHEEYPDFIEFWSPNSVFFVNFVVNDNNNGVQAFAAFTPKPYNPNQAVS